MGIVCLTTQKSVPNSKEKGKQVIKMEILSWILTILLISLVFLFFHFRRFRGSIEESGLPMVKPFLCFGSAPMLYNKIIYHIWYHEKHKELGKSFTRYEGVTPCISTIDPDFIKEVTVKQFDNFTDVVDIDFSPGQTTLDVSRGDTWRALRKLMSPTFTTGKLKSMLHPIEGIADSTIEFIEEKAKENPEIDFKPIMQGFALDSISKVAFGMETKCRNGEDTELLKLSTSIIQNFAIKTYPIMFLWNFFFHFPGVMKYIGFWPEEAVQIRKMTEGIMIERENNNIHVGDFVDRLRDFKKVASAPINDEMIDAQGMIFLLAGFETTANTLGSFVYFVSKNPEVQEKIVEEIKDNIGSDDITHENISKLEYLEACIMETLRINPPVTEHDRTCVNDCIVNGIKIKKGTLIKMPIYAAHYDPDFFPDPERYQPERFLKENSDDIIPYTWRPFGAGNRVCIGQRFAMMEMKLFIAKFLSKFKVFATEKSGVTTDNGYFGFFYYPESIAKIEVRNQIEE